MGAPRLLALVAALVLAGCAGTDDAEPPPRPAAPPSPVTLYVLDGEHLRAVAATVEGEATPSAALSALVANEAGRPSEIPPGARVRGVEVAGGTATADLSGAFARGGGSLSMQARVAQVVYTLTAFPSVERVTIELDGEPVEAIGGEGVPAQELTRADFEPLLPPIFVDPPPRSSASPLRVSGSARVFEANVSLRLEVDGEELASGFATATEGAPGRGDFEAELPFEVEEPTDATLVVFEQSAATAGGENHVVRYPVRLCPASAPC